MVRLFSVVGLLAALTVVLAPAPALTFSSGSPSAHSGAPGEPTCNTSGCHVGAGTNEGGGSVTLALPERYVPGETVTIEVGVVNPNSPGRQGFQVSVKDGTGSDVGAFVLTDPTNTKLVGTGNVTHTLAGTDRLTWEVAWQAPDPAPEEVTVYAAGLGGNGDGGRLGDNTYTESTVMTRQPSTNVETDPVPVRVRSAFPNPFRETTTVEFDLARPATVSLHLVDAAGRHVWTLPAQPMPSGVQRLNIDGRRLAAGAYTYVLTEIGAGAPLRTSGRLIRID